MSTSFRDAYNRLYEVMTELQEGSCSLEDYTIETKEYGDEVCGLFDEMIDLLRQIDTRLDGLEEAVRNK